MNEITPPRNLRLVAYRQLGVTPENVQSSIKISAQLRQMAAVMRRAGQPKVTRKLISERGDDIPIEQSTEHQVPYGPGHDVARSWPWYLETCEDPSARRVLEAYYSLAPSMRRNLPIEAYCCAAGISPMRILELLTGACVRVGATASTIVAAVNHPRVVQATVDNALTPEGHADRTDLHKAVGFLPTPRGAHTNIQIVQNAQANATPTVVSAPAPEQSIRRLVNRFNESKQLPAGAPSAVSVMPDEDLVQAELVDEEDVL